MRGRVADRPGQGNSGRLPGSQCRVSIARVSNTVNKPTKDHEDLIAGLRRIAGRRHVSIGSVGNAPYCHGIRFGRQNAFAIVWLDTIRDLWVVLEFCVAADTAIVMQAGNTRLRASEPPLSAGICNNSGGALIERGPAYTELALYARVRRLPAGLSSSMSSVCISATLPGRF